MMCEQLSPFGKSFCKNAVRVKSFDRNKREDMFNRDKFGISIARYLHQPLANEKVSVDDSMEVVMEKFKRTGNYNLVVLNKGKYVGFVSRANVFNAYRQTLIDVSHE